MTMDMSHLPTSVEGVTPDTSTNKNVIKETNPAFQAKEDAVIAKGDSKPSEKPLTTSEQTAETVRRLKVKLDGKEQEVDEAELIKGYQKHKAADAAFQASSELRKQSEHLLNQLKNPKTAWKVLEQLGYNPNDFATNFLVDQYQNERLTPEQRELNQLKAEKEERDNQTKAQAEKAQKEELERNMQVGTAKLHEMINDALKNNTDLPNSNYVKQKMIYFLAQAWNHPSGNYGHIRPHHIMPMVRDEIIAENKQMYGESDYATLERIWGEDIMKKVRHGEAAKLKSGIHNKQAVQKPQVTTKKKTSKGISPQQWRENMDKRFPKE